MGLPMTPTWELIADKYYKQTTKGTMLPVFPVGLQALENKIIEVPGYMIPIKAGMTHDRFFISILPIYQCDFCGQNGFPSMVEVHATKPLPFSDNPMKIRGKLLLDSSGDPSSSEILIVNAELIGQ